MSTNLTLSSTLTYIAKRGTLPRVDAEREDELNRALELFHFAFRAFTARPDKILEARGLQRVHHRILYFVARNAGLTVSDLLSILGVTKQSRTGKGDRRTRLLRLTVEGERLERALSGSQRKKLAAVFDKLGSNSERAWRKVMSEIAERATVED
jgi:DNA-binding MarR family transcriptional regulator